MPKPKTRTIEIFTEWSCGHSGYTKFDTDGSERAARIAADFIEKSKKGRCLLCTLMGDNAHDENPEDGAVAEAGESEEEESVADRSGIEPVAGGKPALRLEERARSTEEQRERAAECVDDDRAVLGEREFQALSGKHGADSGDDGYTRIGGSVDVVGAPSTGVDLLLDLRNSGALEFLYGVPPDLEMLENDIYIAMQLGNGGRLRFQINTQQAVALHRALGAVIDVTKERHIEKSLNDVAKESREAGANFNEFFSFWNDIGRKIDQIDDERKEGRD